MASLPPTDVPADTHVRSQSEDERIMAALMVLAGRRHIGSGPFKTLALEYVYGIRMGMLLVQMDEEAAERLETAFVNVFDAKDPKAQDTQKLADHFALTLIGRIRASLDREREPLPDDN